MCVRARTSYGLRAQLIWCRRLCVSTPARECDVVKIKNLLHRDREFFLVNGPRDPNDYHKHIDMCIVRIVVVITFRCLLRTSPVVATKMTMSKTVAASALPTYIEMLTNFIMFWCFDGNDGSGSSSSSIASCTYRFRSWKVRDCATKCHYNTWESWIIVAARSIYSYERFVERWRRRWCRHNLQFNKCFRDMTAAYWMNHNIILWCSCLVHQSNMNEINLRIRNHFFSSFLFRSSQI